MRSDDGGITWTPSRRLPDGFVGPVRNKPVELPSGTILCGASTENEGWRSAGSHARRSAGYANPGRGWFTCSS